MRILSLEFLESLEAITAGQFGALAPRLQSFAWIDDGPRARGERPLYEQKFRPTISLFAGDSVKSLYLPHKGDHERFLHGVATRLPHLENLGLMRAGLDLARSIIATTLWPNLQSLKLRNLSDDMIPHLAAFPRLSSLTFRFVKDIFGQHAQAVSKGPTSFQRLEELIVPCDNLHTAAKILQHLPQLTGIRVLNLSAHASASPLVSQNIINIVHDRVDKSTLKTLELGDNEIPEIGAEPEDVNPLEVHDQAVIDMRPLFVFPNLTKLILRFEGRVRVTPDEVAVIASLWSNLEHLDLCGAYPITRRPSIDYTHLFQVAEGCPKLHTLGLPFDATGVTGTETCSAGPFTRLKDLRVAGSLVKYPACVAAFFLRTNFPNTHLVHGYNSFEIDSHWRRWIEVARALELHDLGW